MARERKGSILKRKSDGLLFARVTYTDVTGKRKDKLRRAESRTHARELIKEMLRELDDHGEHALDVNRKTFPELADHFEKNYLTEAEYVGGRKVSGLRSLATPKVFLKTLRSHFGKRQLRSITYGDVRAFRDARRRTPTRSGEPRSITSVNRELALLRRMLNVAQREGWILKNPMNGGDPLICVADEHKRERVITFDEEARLLASCTGKRQHLRPIIIAALETGMRKGELLKMKWSDVDFERRIITVRAFNTKTMRAREVAMTARLNSELEQMWQASPQDPDALAFGIKDDVKHAFDSARRAAELTDVRFHDLRHTHATRLVAAHIPLPEVGRALGHTQANTTYRYVNANFESARRVADALDSMRATRDAQEIATTEIVH